MHSAFVEHILVFRTWAKNPGLSTKKEEGHEMASKYRFKKLSEGEWEFQFLPTFSHSWQPLGWVQKDAETGLFDTQVVGFTESEEGVAGLRAAQKIVRRMIAEKIPSEAHLILGRA